MRWPHLESERGAPTHLRAHLVQHALDLIISDHSLLGPVELGERVHNLPILHQRGDAIEKVALRAPLRHKGLLQCSRPRLLVGSTRRARREHAQRRGHVGRHGRGPAARRRRPAGARFFLIRPRGIADKRRRKKTQHRAQHALLFSAGAGGSGGSAPNKPLLLLAGLGAGFLVCLRRCDLLLPLFMQVDLTLRNLCVCCEVGLQLRVGHLPR